MLVTLSRDHLYTIYMCKIIYWWPEGGRFRQVSLHYIVHIEHINNLIFATLITKNKETCWPFNDAMLTLGLGLGILLIHEPDPRQSLLVV